MSRFTAITCSASLLLTVVGCSSMRGETKVSEKKAPAEPPSAESRIAEAVRFEREGNDRAAREKYMEALTSDPNSVFLQHRLGVVCDRLGKFDEAQEHYFKALRATPQDASLHNDLGYSYYLSGRLEPAERELCRCLSIDANNPRAHNNLGLVLGRMGRSEDSLAEFRRSGASEEQAAASLAFASPRKASDDAVAYRPAAARGVERRLDERERSPAEREPVASSRGVSIPAARSDVQLVERLEPLR